MRRRSRPETRAVGPNLNPARGLGGSSAIIRHPSVSTLLEFPSIHRFPCCQLSTEHRHGPKKRAAALYPWPLGPVPEHQRKLPRRAARRRQEQLPQDHASPADPALLECVLRQVGALDLVLVAPASDRDHVTCLPLLDEPQRSIADRTSLSSPDTKTSQKPARATTTAMRTQPTWSSSAPRSSRCRTFGGTPTTPLSSR